MKFHNKQALFLLLFILLAVFISLQCKGNRPEQVNELSNKSADWLDKSFINDQIVCAQNIISGACKGEKYESFAGSALKCSYQSASIAYNPDTIYIKR